ncbi:MAG: hypothetical protein B6D76_03565 [gamma proteobacterium symbiont of Stewartia floridana]|nr:MAG: hypothetical protein B6D76_03565 [gamma proteobacterium symbiont of Stewartia floridana]RLW58993.1 MAG: hypothetical protein B6D75_11995 [gamma proteobacterium symbiont of Stewartia floridana]
MARFKSKESRVKELEDQHRYATEDIDLSTLTWSELQHKIAYWVTGNVMAKVKEEGIPKGVLEKSVTLDGDGAERAAKELIRPYIHIPE